MKSIEIKRSKIYFLGKWYLFIFPILIIIGGFFNDNIKEQLGNLVLALFFLAPLLLFSKSLFKDKKPSIQIDKNGILFRNLQTDHYFNWDEIIKISIESRGLSIGSYRNQIEIHSNGLKKFYSSNISNYDITPFELRDIVKNISDKKIDVNCY